MCASACCRYADNFYTVGLLVDLCCLDLPPSACLALRFLLFSPLLCHGAPCARCVARAIHLRPMIAVRLSAWLCCRLLCQRVPAAATSGQRFHVAGVCMVLLLHEVGVPLRCSVSPAGSPPRLFPQRGLCACGRGQAQLRWQGRVPPPPCASRDGVRVVTAALHDTTAIATRVGRRSTCNAPPSGGRRRLRLLPLPAARRVRARRRRYVTDRWPPVRIRTRSDCPTLRQARRGLLQRTKSWPPPLAPALLPEAGEVGGAPSMLCFACRLAAATVPSKRVARVRP